MMHTLFGRHGLNLCPIGFEFASHRVSVRSLHQFRPGVCTANAHLELVLDVNFLLIMLQKSVMDLL